MKDFLIIGNKNTLFWTNIFPIYMEGKIRFGYNILYFFYLEDNAEKWDRVIDNKKCNNFHGTGRWITTLKVKKNNPPLPLIENIGFKKFDTYDAWNTDNIFKIPDTNDIIGCPVGIVDFLNEEQFDIIGELHTGNDDYDYAKPKVEGKDKYIRILIKKK